MKEAGDTKVARKPKEKLLHLVCPYLFLWAIGAIGDYKGAIGAIWDSLGAIGGLTPPKMCTSHVRDLCVLQF